MTERYPEKRISFQRSLALLRESGGGLVQQLENDLPQTAKAMRSAVTDAVSEYSASANPDTLPALDSHIVAQLQDIVRLLAGGEPGDFAFVRAHAARCAEQHFPLEALLQVYRLGQRMVTRWLEQAVASADPVSVIAEFASAYADTISTIAASEYVAQTRLLAAAEGDRRTELLSILLSGYDESDAKAARLLRRAGYLEQRQAYCVVVVQSVNPAEMELQDRAQRIVNSLGDVIVVTSIRMLAGVRDNLVTAIFSDVRRQSGWTTPQTSLASRLFPLLQKLGPAVLTGLSVDKPSTSFLPRAWQEASMALDFASVTRRVVQFGDLPVRSLLLHRGADYVRSVTPGWITALIAADAKGKGSLIQTLRAVAEADLNVQKAGRLLDVHPNTVYARLDRIQELTGMDGRRHHDLVDLLLAADCWKE